MRNHVKGFGQFISESRLVEETSDITAGKLTTSEITALSEFLSSIKKSSYGKMYTIWKQDPTNGENIAGQSVSLTGNEAVMSLSGWKQNTPLIWSLYKGGKKIDGTYFKIEKVKGNCRDCNKLIYSLYPGELSNSDYSGRGVHNQDFVSGIRGAIDSFNGCQENVG